MRELDIMSRWVFSAEWAAGFFDGEGCVSIQRRQRGGFLEHHLSVQVGQATRQCLDELAARYDGSVTRDRKAGGAFFRWRVHGQSAERFLRTIHPHSLVKRREIEAAIELREAIGLPSHRMKPGAFERKELAYAKWRQAREDVALSRRGA